MGRTLGAPPTASSYPAGRAATVWENLRGQIHLRGDGFIGQHVSRGAAGFSEIPRVLQLGWPTSTRGHCDHSTRRSRRDEATLDHGVTLNEIASRLGVHCHGESPDATKRNRVDRNWVIRHCKTRPRHPEADAYTALVGFGDLPPRGKLPFATVGQREGVRSTPRTASRARLVMSSTDL